MKKQIYAALFGLIVVIFLLTNTLLSGLGAQYSLSLDLTANQLYGLSEQTTEVVSTIDAPTSIIVLSAEVDFPSMLQEMLAGYARLSDALTVSYVDPYENPTLLETYRQKGLSLSASDILIVQDTYYKQVAYDDLLVYSGTTVTGVQLEQCVTSALANLQGEQAVVQFTIGHNETSATELETIFSQNNYLVQSSAVGDSISADMLVIVSPKADFTESEIAALETYLDNDGSIIVAFESGGIALPNLEALLSAWNIVVENNVVYEKTAYLSSNPLNIVPMYASHTMNTYFATNAFYTVMPSARSITIASNSTVETSAVLASTTDAYTVEYADGVLLEDTATTGQVALAVVGERTVSGASAGSILVIGSAQFLSADVLSSSSFANSMFMTQAINYFNPAVDSVYIAPKTITLDPLAMVTSDATMFGILFAGVLPLLVLGYGAFVMMGRKKL